MKSTCDCRRMKT